MIKGVVKGRSLTIIGTDGDVFTSGSVGLKIKFTFDDEWDGLAKQAVFENGSEKYIATESDNEVEVPYEVLSVPGRVLRIGIRGTNGTTLVIPTIYAECRIYEGSDKNGASGQDWSPSEVDQVLGIIGDPGELETTEKSNLVGAVNELVEEVSQKMPDVTYGTPTTLVDTTTLAFSQYGDHDWYSSAENPFQTFTRNEMLFDKIYRITWDGVVYEIPAVQYDRTCVFVSGEGAGRPRGVRTYKAIGKVDALGNATRIGTDAPFAIVADYIDSDDYAVTTTSLYVFAFDTASSHSIKIESIPFTRSIADPQLYMPVDLQTNVPMLWKGTGKSGTILGYAGDASGDYSYAEGRGSKVSGTYSHAEGFINLVSSTHSHAEGSQNRVSGMISHAEGQINIVSGSAAHVEGVGNEVEGLGSHVQGRFNISKHSYQHVFGKYNELDPSTAATNENGMYIEMAGNGTAVDQRSNARTLDWEGNEEIAGDLTLFRNASARKVSEELLKPFPTEHESGAIVDFSDGANDIPVKSLIVDINPVQDLRGYGSPWPAGGSKNLFKATPYGGTYDGSVGADLKSGDPMQYTVTNAGQVEIDVTTAWRYRMFATDSLAAGTYTARTYGANANIRGSIYVTDSELLVKSTVYNQSAAGWHTPQTVTVSAGDRIAVCIGSNVVGKVITEFQAESGSTSTTTVPFENICPITGWTGAKAYRTGKNLFDQSQLLQAENWTLNSDGYYTGTRRTLHAAFRYGFPVLPKFKDNTRYTLSLVGYTDISSSNAYLIFEYTDGTQQILRISNTTPETKVLTSYANRTIKTIIGTYGEDPSSILYLKNIQLEEGTSATDYEPFGSTIPISWQSEAGTIYGGTLNVTTGVLTVDKVCVDLGTLTFSLMGNTSVRQVWQRKFTDIKTKPSSAAISAISSQFKAVSASATWQPGDMSFSGGNSTWVAFCVNPGQYAEHTEFETAMSGVQFCYELAEPLTYQLTPHEVDTILGVNNIWADTGDVDVTYRADIGMYISKLLSQA